MVGIMRGLVNSKRGPSPYLRELWAAIVALLIDAEVWV
jgi:hypothetical protein